MSKYTFEKGDDYEPSEASGDAAEAGIHVIDAEYGDHGNRIEIKVYGADWVDSKAMEAAKELRDFVLNKLEEGSADERAEEKK